MHTRPTCLKNCAADVWFTPQPLPPILCRARVQSSEREPPPGPRAVPNEKPSLPPPCLGAMPGFTERRESRWWLDKTQAAKGTRSNCYSAFARLIRCADEADKKYELDSVSGCFYRLRSALTGCTQD